MSNDEKGLIWPEAIAPYKVHLLGLNLEESSIRAKAEETYELFVQKGVEVLFDDRLGINPGEKFADADLIGIPWRVVVSKRTSPNYELKSRNSQEAVTMDIDSLLNSIA